MKTSKKTHANLTLLLVCKIVLGLNGIFQIFWSTFATFLLTCVISFYGQLLS